MPKFQTILILISSILSRTVALILDTNHEHFLSDAPLEMNAFLFIKKKIRGKVVNIRPNYRPVVSMHFMYFV